ncbi:nephronectin [Labeo rohita]|uniref:nephronectin n=1 Tax=Labeo rohita TaxID=84645 RepID=UPI0021E21151|nr:nephronectin [Labeo rohita]
MPFKSYMKGRIFQHFIIIGLLCVPHIAIPNRLKFCVGPDRCSCMEGYKGKDCNKDVNECGLPIRPCSHRCMNTMGSYRCFCNHGYMLDTDGKSCVKKLNCTSLRCQFGCQIERDGEIGCLCPPGLYLALDNRTCKDINECDSLSHTCIESQSCRNTFGSFICVCKDGYVLGTLKDSVTCRDKDECLTGNHRCSHQASCVNTEGSYTCKCEKGYTGDGFRCWKRSNRLPWAAMYFQYKRSKQIRPV